MLSQTKPPVGDPIQKPYQPFAFSETQKTSWNLGTELYGEQAMMHTLPEDHTAGFFESWWAYVANDIWLGDLATDFISGNSSAIFYGTNPTVKGIGRMLTSALALPLGAVDPRYTAEQYRSTIDEAWYDSVHTVSKLFGDTAAKPMDMQETLMMIPDELKSHPDTHAIIRLAHAMNSAETVGHRDAMLSSWLREDRNRRILQDTPWYNALLAGLLSLPIDLSAWADVFLTRGLYKAGALTRNITGSAARHYGKVTATGMATGAVSGTAREFLLYQGQELRTLEESVGAVAIETVLGGFIGTGMEFLGQNYTRAVAGRILSEATGGTPPLPVPKIEDVVGQISMQRSALDEGLIEDAYVTAGVSDLRGDGWVKDDYLSRMSEHIREVKGLDSVQQALEYGTLTREEWDVWDAKFRNLMVRHAVDGDQILKPILSEGNQATIPGVLHEQPLPPQDAMRVYEINVFEGVHKAEASIMSSKADQVADMAANYIASGLSREALEAAGFRLDPSDPSTEAVVRLLDNFKLQDAAVVLKDGPIDPGDLLSIRGTKGRVVADGTEDTPNDPMPPVEVEAYFREELGFDSPEYGMLEPYLEHIVRQGKKVSLREVGALFSGDLPIKVEANVTQRNIFHKWKPKGAHRTARQITVTIKRNDNHPLFKEEGVYLEGMNPLARYNVDSTTTYRISNQDSGRGYVLLLEDVKYGDGAARNLADKAETKKAVKSGKNRGKGRARPSADLVRKQLDMISMRKALGEYYKSLGFKYDTDIRLVNFKSSTGATAQRASGGYDPHNMWAENFMYRRLGKGAEFRTDFTKEEGWDTGADIDFEDVHDKYKNVGDHAVLVLDAKVWQPAKGDNAFFQPNPSDEPVHVYLDKGGYVVGFINDKGKATTDHLGKHHTEVIVENNPGDHSKTSTTIDGMLQDQLGMASPADIKTLQRQRTTGEVEVTPLRTHQFNDEGRGILTGPHAAKLMDPKEFDRRMAAANPAKRGSGANTPEADEKRWGAWWDVMADIGFRLGYHTGARDEELYAMRWSDLEVVRSGDGKDITSARILVRPPPYKKAPKFMQRWLSLDHDIDFVERLIAFRKLELERLTYFSEKAKAVHGKDSPYKIAKGILDREGKKPTLGEESGVDSLILRTYNEKTGDLRQVSDPSSLERSGTTSRKAHGITRLEKHMTRKLYDAGDTGWQSKATKGNSNDEHSQGNRPLSITRRTAFHLAETNSAALADPSGQTHLSTVNRRLFGQAEPRIGVAEGKTPTTYEQSYKAKMLTQPGKTDKAYDVRKKWAAPTPAVARESYNSVGNLAPPSYYNPQNFPAGALRVLAPSGDIPIVHDLDFLRTKALATLDKLGPTDKDYEGVLDYNILVALSGHRLETQKRLVFDDIVKARGATGPGGDDRIKISWTEYKGKKGKEGVKKTRVITDPHLLELIQRKKKYLLEAKTVGFNPAKTPIITEGSSLASRHRRFLKGMDPVDREYLVGPDGEGYNLNMLKMLRRAFVAGAPEGTAYLVKKRGVPTWVQAKNMSNADLIYQVGWANEASKSFYTSRESLWRKVGEEDRTTRSVMAEVRALHDALSRILEKSGIVNPTLEDYLDLTLDVKTLRSLMGGKSKALLRKRYSKGEQVSLRVEDQGYDTARLSAIQSELRQDIVDVHHILTMDDLVYRTKTIWSTVKGERPKKVSPKQHFASIGTRQNMLTEYSSIVHKGLDDRAAKWNKDAGLLEGVAESSVESPKPLAATKVGDPETAYDTNRVKDALMGISTHMKSAKRRDTKKQHIRLISPETRKMEIIDYSQGDAKPTTSLEAYHLSRDPGAQKDMLLDRKDDLFSTREGEVRALYRFRDTMVDIIKAMKNPNASDALEEVFHLIDTRLLLKTVALDYRGGVTDEMIDALDQFAGDRTSVEGRERLVKAFIDFVNNDRAADVGIYAAFKRVLEFIGKFFRIVESHPGEDMTGVMTPEVRKAFSQIVRRGRPSTPAQVALRVHLANSVEDPGDPTQLGNALMVSNPNDSVEVAAAKREARMLRQVLEDHNEAGIEAPGEEQKLLDMVLVGAPQEVVELYGARVGTIAGKLVRSLMWLTPNSGMLASDNASAQRVATLLSPSGILTMNAERTGPSLDRMASGLSNNALNQAYWYGEVAKKNIKDGGVLSVAEVDRLTVLLDQHLAPGEPIPKDFHILAPDGERSEVFEAAEMTDVDIATMEKTVKAYRHAMEQEDTFLNTTGVQSSVDIKELREFYRKNYGERLTKRIPDAALISDPETKVQARERVELGWQEYHDVLVGEGKPETLKLQRIEDTLNETKMALNDDSLSSGQKERLAKAVVSLESEYNLQEADMRALKPNREMAATIVDQWAIPPMSVLDQSWLGITTSPIGVDPQTGRTRTILISDKWIHPYLKQSASEHHVQFAKYSGVRGLSVGKLGRTDQKNFITRTTALVEKAEAIEQEMRVYLEGNEAGPGGEADLEGDIPQLREWQSRLEDIQDEITTNTDIQMLLNDLHLMPTSHQDVDFNHVVEGQVGYNDRNINEWAEKIQRLGGNRLGLSKQVRNARRQLLEDNLSAERKTEIREARDELIEELKANADELNELSKVIGDRGGRLKDGHIPAAGRGYAGEDVEGEPAILRENTLGFTRSREFGSRQIREYEEHEEFGLGDMRVIKTVRRMIDSSMARRSKGLGEIRNTVKIINSIEHLAAGIHRDASSRYIDGSLDSASVKKEQDYLTARLRVIHNRLHGKHNEVSKNSPPWLRYIGKNVRNLVYSMSMGGVVRSSIPDVAGTVVVQGFGPSLVAFSKVAKRHIANILADADDKGIEGFDRFMYAMEVTLGNYRQAALNAIDTHKPLHSIGAAGKSPGERITDVTAALARGTSTFSAITRWNGFWKEVNTVASMNHMLRMGRSLRAGETLSAWDLRWLRRAGVSDADLQKMSMLSDRFGREENTAFGSNFLWSGEYAWEAVDGISSKEVARLRNNFKGALHTMSEFAILTPDAGNVPGIADSTEAGNLITQFKKFFMVATVNVTAPMTQRIFAGDPRVMSHIASMSMLGGLVYWWSSAARGVDPLPAIMNPDRYSDDEWWNNVMQLVYESIDRSGMLGIFSELLNLTERLGVGPSVAFGGDGLSRSKTRPIGQIVLGPAAGKIEEAGVAFHNAMKATFTDEPVSPGALRSWRRLAPMNNLLPFTMVVDQGLSIWGGAEARRRYIHDFGSLSAGDKRDFYYSNFKWSEHRLADMIGVDVDYSKWNPSQRIGL